MALGWVNTLLCKYINTIKSIRTPLWCWVKHMHTLGSCSIQGIRAACVLTRVTPVSCQLPGRVIHTGKGKIKSKGNPHTQLLATDHQPLFFTCSSWLKLLCALPCLGHLSRHLRIYTEWCTLEEAFQSSDLHFHWIEVILDPPVRISSQRSWINHVRLLRVRLLSSTAGISVSALEGWHQFISELVHHRSSLVTPVLLASVLRHQMHFEHVVFWSLCHVEIHMVNLAKWI